MWIKLLLSNFLFKSVGLYIILILLGLSLNIKIFIADNFRESNNRKYNQKISNTKLVFQKTNKAGFDTKVYLKYANKQQWTFAEYFIDSWYFVFVPNALFVSLLLATKFKNVKQKIISFFIGFILTYILIDKVLYIRVYILKIEAQHILGDYSNTLYDKTIVFFHNNFAVYSWICFVLPVFAWIAVSFRTKMFQQNLNKSFE